MKPLSFIIITYNRPDDMLELAKNLCQLDSAVDLLEEIIIVNNASTASYGPLLEFIQSRPEMPFRYFDAPSNLGVAKGRNFGLEKGTAPIVIMLDDDAVLQNKDALTNLVKAFQTPRTSRPVAVISFKVLYYENLQMQKNALPHKKYDKYKDRQQFDTYFYAGGAHAIKRSVMDEVGYYPAGFFYGMEEYDLSYRVLNAGYAIEYDAGVVMLHKESPLGRKPKDEKVRMMWVNKAKVAYRYLPKIYFISTAVMWSLFYLKSTGFDFKGFFKGWREIFSIPKEEKRTVVSSDTLKYLRSVEARLSY